MKQLFKNILKFLAHIVGWLLFGYLQYHFFSDLSDYSTNSLLIVAANIGQFALILYTAFYYTIPHLLHNRKVGKYILVSLVIIAISSLFDLAPAVFLNSDITVDIEVQDESIRDHLRYNNPNFPDYALAIYYASFFFINIWILIGISAIKLIYDAIKNHYQMEVMAREKLQTELKYMREQNNPHFLFNNLNSLYFMIEEAPATAQQMLLKLSNMLRYQLYDSNSEKIGLHKEFDYIRNYIDLQQMRYSEELNTELNLEDNADQCSIEPYLLFTLVENAFKHGVDKHPANNFLKVYASVNNHWLTFTVENPLDKNEDTGDHEKGGFGLQNLSKRLNYLYPNQHHYEVEKGENLYRTTLKLKLSCQ